MRHVIDPSVATLVAPTGTIWQGSSRIVSPLGLQAEVQWETTFLRPGADFVLSHENSLIKGRFEPGINNHSSSLPMSDAVILDVGRSSADD